MPAQKIATCCYCGTRAALVLRGKERHELSCSSCGAPLHEMKILRSGHVEDSGVVKPSAHRKTGRQTVRERDRRKKKKKRKSFKRELFEEVFDLLEDIFD